MTILPLLTAIFFLASYYLSATITIVSFLCLMFPSNTFSLYASSFITTALSSFFFLSPRYFLHQKMWPALQNLQNLILMHLLLCASDHSYSIRLVEKKRGGVNRIIKSFYKLVNIMILYVANMDLRSSTRLYICTHTTICT